MYFIVFVTFNVFVYARTDTPIEQHSPLIKNLIHVSTYRLWNIR